MTKNGFRQWRQWSSQALTLYHIYIMFFLLYYRVGTGLYSVFWQNELWPNPVGIYKTITYPEPLGADQTTWVDSVRSARVVLPSLVVKRTSPRSSTSIVNIKLKFSARLVNKHLVARTGQKLNHLLDDNVLKDFTGECPFYADKLWIQWFPRWTLGS